MPFSLPISMRDKEYLGANSFQLLTTVFFFKLQNPWAALLEFSSAIY